VLNGKERGGPLKTISHILLGDAQKLGVLDPSYHVFLEDLSGDYFTFDKNSNEWKPKGNFGLHYSRISASQQGAIVKGPTDTLKKVKTYEPAEDVTKPHLVITGCNETLI
jgi:hypothetical protein